jgi:dTDP-4-dehydrorhamnose 3,5-epimerase
MFFQETKLKGAFRIELEKREDERGFFARAWCRREFAEHGLATEFVQANLSYNRKKGTLRGMHFQAEPHAEVKMVRCFRGAVYDVIIDLRPGSATCGKWIGVELTEANRTMLYVPEGFAHGFQTLTDDAELFYQVSRFYHREAERGIRWDDPTFAIEWPGAEERIISEKDRSWLVPFPMPSRQTQLRADGASSTQER